MPNKALGGDSIGQKWDSWRAILSNSLGWIQWRLSPKNIYPNKTTPQAILTLRGDIEEIQARNTQPLFASPCRAVGIVYRDNGKPSLLFSYYQKQWVSSRKNWGDWRVH